MKRLAHKLDTQPAIVLGCHKIGLGIIRALGQEDVPVVGVSYGAMDMGRSSKYLIAHYMCPHPDRDPAGFVSCLRHLGQKWNGSVLVPSDDATLIPVSRNLAILNPVFKVAAADWSVVEKCIVKKHTYSLASKIGVPCPKTLMPESHEALVAFAHEYDFPLIVKPSVGHRFYEKFKRKMIVVHTFEELISEYSQMVDARIEVMIQENIPGGDCQGANYNSFFIDGCTLIEVTAQKVRLSPITIGFPRVVVSKWIPELSGPSGNFLNELGYTGFSCIEYKKDVRDGIFKLMEINARLNLSSALSVKSGINFPYILYHHALTGEIPKESRGFKENVFWVDIGKDALETLRSWPRERYKIVDYLRPYLGPRVFSILSLSDMGPTFKRFLDLLRNALNRLIIGISKRSHS
jgi:D-aspartate ligase